MLKIKSPTYLFFYISFLLVICSAIFFDKLLLVYVKPVVQLALILLYLKNVEKVKLLFPVCMLAVLVTNIFVYLDFLKYFDFIVFFVSVYYVGGIFLLKKYIVKKDISIKKIVSPPVLVSTLLIGYLIFNIAQLVLPKVGTSIISTLLITIGALLFSVVCFIVYLADRFEKSIYLFVTASCTIFIDSLLAINEIYYYTRVFTVIINIAEIIGLYFLTSFFVETRKKNLILKEENFQ